MPQPSAVNPSSLHASPLWKSLVSLGVIHPEHVEPFYPQVRDREDIAVLRCAKSGVIFLSDFAHMDPSHYVEKDGMAYWDADDWRGAVRVGHTDAVRRAEQFQDLIANRSWLDFGTGAGGLLVRLNEIAREAVAVELQREARQALIEHGYTAFESVEQMAPGRLFDIVTLFHVMEHLTDPLTTLRQLHDRLKSGGKIIVEVPHARDFLMDFLHLEPFKKFTFWSEHLILHTRSSLETFLHAAGFEAVSIRGFQRYPLSNHLHWLAKGKPGGHEAWAELDTPALCSAYGEMLMGMDRSDTLIAYATKP
ncbi:MAG: class I SAM-dependent methyltransferase [Magnetococcales bacterium]|nr:class I SAM-dependent methyltransferase [Magnetococcales bacterium]